MQLPAKVTLIRVAYDNRYILFNPEKYFITNVCKNENGNKLVRNFDLALIIYLKSL